MEAQQRNRDSLVFIVYELHFRKVLVLWHQGSSWLVGVPEMCPDFFIAAASNSAKNG